MRAWRLGWWSIVEGLDVFANVGACPVGERSFGDSEQRTERTEAPKLVNRRGRFDIRTPAERPEHVSREQRSCRDGRDERGSEPLAPSEPRAPRERTPRKTSEKPGQQRVRERPHAAVEPEHAVFDLERGHLLGWRGDDPATRGESSGFRAAGTRLVSSPALKARAMTISVVSSVAVEVVHGNPKACRIESRQGAERAVALSERNAPRPRLSGRVTRWR
jgi:hypothetical protein